MPVYRMNAKPDEEESDDDLQKSIESLLAQVKELASDPDLPWHDGHVLQGILLVSLALMKRIELMERRVVSLERDTTIMKASR